MSLPSVTGVDHFIVLVRDIDRAHAQFLKLGFALTNRGFHTHGGSANHTAPFSAGNYFEILYTSDERRSSGPFNARPLSFEGPIRAVLQTADSRKVHDELVALGYDVPDPWDLERPVHLPEGTRTARFLNQAFPPVPPIIGFGTCQHRTRDLIWRPEWQNHPNTAQGIAGLILVHPDPAILRPDYAALFGEDRVFSSKKGLVLQLGQTPLTVLTPDAFVKLYPSVPLPTDLAQGWFAGATITVTSLEVAAAVLSKGGVPFVHTPRGSIAVTPSFAVNTLIEFSAQT